MVVQAEGRVNKFGSLTNYFGVCPSLWFAITPFERFYKKRRAADLVDC